MADPEGATVGGPEDAATAEVGDTRIGAAADRAAGDRAKADRDRRRLRVVLVTALLVAVVAGGAAYLRSDLRDPYRVGTSHRVEVTFTPPCVNVRIEMGDLHWKTSDPTSTAWGRATTPGTLEIVGRDDNRYRAIFTADRGGTLTMTGYRGFSDMECAIA